MTGRRATLLALLCVAPTAAARPGDGPAAPEVANRALLDANASCNDCHQGRTGPLRFEDGDSVSLVVEQRSLSESVHGEKLVCTDCHRYSGEIPHAAARWRSHRDYTLAQSATCRRCHFINYARTLESVHTRMNVRAAASAPGCVDCHGAHSTQPARSPRAAISRRCGGCHQEQFEVYAASVHGRALLDEGNEDVPVCTDCHRAHDIADPRGDAFSLRIPLLCGRCHADEERMAAYGLSTQVLQSYLSDFHGATAALYRETGEQGRVVAVCTDCHGVHDIASTRRGGLSAVKNRLQKNCARCHQGAPVNFPDAWLPHYEASFTKAPLVLAVKAFRWVFLPLVVGGLLLQILLHIYRIAANRW